MLIINSPRPSRCTKGNKSKIVNAAANRYHLSSMPKKFTQNPQLHKQLPRGLVHSSINGHPIL